MTVQCPYNKLDLQIALLSLKEEVVNKLNDEVAEKINKIALEPTAINIANYHGVTAELLLASPNYKTLHSQYMAHITVHTIEILTSLGFTDKQAWALILTTIGSMD